MPKIESIRPGGTMDGNLGEYPLADLLLGVLRGNLSGRLDLALGHDPRNALYFKDGVPVSVNLPDLGISVARILAERGDLSKERAHEVQREAEGTGRTESALIFEEELLPMGTLDEGRRRRAREQVVRLFDAGSVRFVFTEGASIPDDAVLTILQPLPIVYEGILKSKDRRIVARFLEENGSASFKLGATYPNGVDPFEWGERVEGIIQQMEHPRSLDEIEELGLQRDMAAVALTALYLAGMIEVQRAGVQSRAERKATMQLEAVSPRGEPIRPAGKGASRGEAPAEDKEPSGLVVHRKSSGDKERMPRSDRVPPIVIDHAARDNMTRPIPRADTAGESYASQLDLIAQRLGPLRGKSYYKVLRVAEGTIGDQIERSYRFLVRQAEEAGEDVALRPFKDALREAFDVLMHPTDGRKYRELAERAKLSPQAVSERQMFEAPPKIDRATRAMGEGRNAEAAYLLEWAQALDPHRRDTKILRGLLGYFRAPRAHRAGEALALKPLVVQELQRTAKDPRLQLCLALILAEEGEASGAAEILDAAPDPDHPLARRVREVMGAR